MAPHLALPRGPTSAPAVRQDQEHRVLLASRVRGRPRKPAPDHGSLPTLAHPRPPSQGEYSAKPGSASCSKCAAGSIAKSDATGCEPCPAGSYAGPSDTYCQTCSRYSGEYAPKPGSTACSKCPAGSIPSDDGAACTLCPAGSYSQEGDGSCSSCETWNGEVSTKAGSASCTR